MYKLKSILLICLVLFLELCTCSWLDYLTEETYCRFTECCIDKNIPANIQDLKSKFNSRLYGQPIVQEELTAALSAHFNAGTKSRKPLVLSFHGVPGTGKTLVANMIVESVYKNGYASKFVRTYNGRVDFPEESKVELYNALINYEVMESLKACPRSMFIFNEVHKMPSGLFESLSSLVDYQMGVLDFSQAVFIFISNTAGVEISDHLGGLMKQGIMRDATGLSHYEYIIRRTAFNMEGGLKKTSLIKAHVVDHFIPFLPLEVEHVRKCIESEFRTWNVQPYKIGIDAIVKEFVVFDSTHGFFAASGCKGLDKVVNLRVQRRRKSEL